MFKGFLGALGFLSILPAGRDSRASDSLSRSMIFFPLAGLFLGGVLCGLDKLFFLCGFPALLSAAAVTLALAFLTGGMHLDGLADTADGFFSGKSGPDILAVMRDPHIGSMGTIALAGDLLLKTALLSAIDGRSRSAALLLMCLLSRWSVVPAMAFFSYARVEGKAKAFISSVSRSTVYLSTVVALFLSGVVLGGEGIILSAAVFGVTFLFGSWSSRKIGGITGDTLGANIEISELFVLSAVCLAESRSLPV
ncbi:MAG: adenosylcobinamide-GDP ribazoletransferase [Candidatus Omnitrophota bacterium]